MEIVDSKPLVKRDMELVGTRRYTTRNRIRATPAILLGTITYATAWGLAVGSRPDPDLALNVHAPYGWFFLALVGATALSALVAWFPWVSLWVIPVGALYLFQVLQPPLASYKSPAIGGFLAIGLFAAAAGLERWLHLPGLHFGGIVSRGSGGRRLMAIKEARLGYMSDPGAESLEQLLRAYEPLGSVAPGDTVYALWADCLCRGMRQLEYARPRTIRHLVKSCYIEARAQPPATLLRNPEAPGILAEFLAWCVTEGHRPHD